MKYIMKYKKYIIGLGIILILIVCAIIYYLEQDNVIVEEKNIFIEEVEVPVLEVSEPIINKITFDIKGEVVNPGVYEIEENKRVIDAINLAGGLTASSYTKILNLSKLLFDEMVIIIYSNEDIKNYMDSNKDIKIEYVYLEQECICPDVVNDACSDAVYATEEILDKVNTNSSININTANKEELMTLSGIGEAKANSIIEYRTTTKFVQIEDIMEISGFGEAMFEKIKDSIIC